MRILIVTNHPFPFGMAQTNRLIAIAKGLIYAGADVNVIITKATENIGTVRNEEYAGNYQGISFQYVTKTTIRPKNKLKRVLLYVKGIKNTLAIVKKENKKQKIDFIFMGLASNLFTILIYLQSRKRKIKFLQERSEYPFISKKKNVLVKLNLFVYLHIICKLFDGFLVISKALQEYFKPYLRENIKLFLLPILVEPDRFNYQDNYLQNYISYCGSMQGDKDGVPILIEAFSKISNRFQDFKLQLIGDTSFLGFKQLKDRIEELKIEDNVVFTGRVEREELPSYLMKSRILALARPFTKQAEGGFPTKLGEYLASGRPVVVTKVGDIPDYLLHLENALLAEPGNVDNFADMLELAITNEELSKQIGKNGKELSNTIFNFRFQGKRLYEWLESI
jgi:glycosyltransferase involved in cell wall biosynthesis